MPAHAQRTMADLPSLLAVLEHDPDDAQTLDGLGETARQCPQEQREANFAAARKALASRGRHDAVVALIDAELEATTDKARKADLFLEKGMVLDSELCDLAGAHGAFATVLELRKGDPMALEALQELTVAEENWQKFAAKYVQEAGASTARDLQTGLYVSAAETYLKFSPDAPEAEAYLKKALSIDIKNQKAAFHLARLMRRHNRWQDLGELLEERAEKAATLEDRVGALVQLYELARGPIGNQPRAERAIRRALGIDPAHPRALRIITDLAAAANDWQGVVAAYHAALRAKRDEDLGMLLQVAMVLWKHVGDLDQAEEYFRRVRKLDPAHPAALDFYRQYYAGKGESGKLISMLKSVEKAPRSREASGEKSISIEIAELAESQNNLEKAIEAWKQHLRAEPTSIKARAALSRLYRKTEKWNALLDLMKDEIEKLPDVDVPARVSRLFEIVEIYRDRLKLDVMVINTYNSILKLDPDNTRAADELAAKFRALGRWNDLIAVLTRKSEAPNVADGERVKLLREVADLWSERFGNFANAIKPLERIVEIAPTDGDALARLKEIYIKRRQWRALIDLLGKEASVLPAADKRAKQSEMARLAAERLGDTRLAIEIHNVILAEHVAVDLSETLTALATLYEREKRYLALAEILHRQIAAIPRDKEHAQEAITLLEKLGQVYSDRCGAPQQAAAAWQQVLELQPGHAKALRTLRELYALAGDFTGLEALYAKLGQEEELVEALLAIADRIDEKTKRLPLVERAAQLAQRRAEAAKDVPALFEKSRQVWERVLAVEPQHVGAAAALAPIYLKQEKWTRLLAVHEIELTALQDPPARLAKIAQIRQLCEQKLASRNLAFGWTVRAFDIDPGSDQMYAEMLRLANEPDQWRDIVAAVERALAGSKLSDPQRLKFSKELARIAARRLGDPEKARNYHRAVLQLQPDDREAEAQLEELATQVADWSELLASYRRRAQREQDPGARAALLMEIAHLQEEKLVDLDGAATTYKEVLGAVKGHAKAVRALARIEEARGDWESLHDTLAIELSQTADGQARFDLLMRLGVLAEHHLDRPGPALGYYRDALGVVSAGGGVRPQAVDSIARLVLTPASAKRLDPKERVAAVRQILPQLEANRQTIEHAAALEVLRASDETSVQEKADIDRTLMQIYHIDLGDPASAWQAGLRVLSAEPGDGDVRHELARLAGQLGRDGEWMQQLGAALATLRAGGGAPAQIRQVATELAKVAGERIGDRSAAERAWMSVLEVEPDAPDAFEVLIGMYRHDERFQDLRALLERRAEMTLVEGVRLQSLLSLAVLEEDILGDPTRAADAYRRVLELDATSIAAYDALDRIYTGSKQWEELEQLLARRVDRIDDPDLALEIAFRRAKLQAHELGNPGRAVDLAEDVLSRDKAHPDIRELLEELLTDPKANAVTMRIARLLEPLYEHEKLWKDLAQLYRVERALVTGTEAVELVARIAWLEENALGSPPNGFDAWLEVLRMDPSHERARVELARLAKSLERWPEATAALEAAVTALPDEDRPNRAALLVELASYYDSQLGDAPRAIAAYRRLLEIDPSSPVTVRRAGSALARLYEDSQAWKELRLVTRMLADHADDGSERRALLARVAALDEERLGDRDSAIATWAEIQTEQPSDAGALNALERLYQQAGKWRELIEVLRNRIDLTSADGEAVQLLARVANIHEQELEETDEAIAAWIEVAERDPNAMVALNQLARLYKAQQRHADLIDVLERQVSLTDGGDRLALEVQIAQLLAGPLGRPVESLERWGTILRQEPEHPQALAAVEKALEDLDLRVMAADTLRPTYAATGQDDKLASLSLRQAEWTDDPATKVRALSEVVRLREFRLGDKAGAFEAQLQTLRWAATEPDLAAHVAETERLAGELGREADLIDVYREVAPNVLDAEIQRRLYLDTADLARGVRHDLDLAREYYQKVLDLQPEDRRALAALESIYREKNDTEKLVEILLRQTDDPNTTDIDERVVALVEAAGLYASLGRPDDAIGVWQQVLESAPERADAIYALEELYRQQQRWHDVVDLYERRLGFVTSIEEAVTLRVQLGNLYEAHIHDIEAAIENYAAALSGNSRQPAALAALERLLSDPEARTSAAEVLEPIYMSQQRWPDLIRVYEVKLDGTSDPTDRLKLTRFVARLYEEQLEDFEHALEWYARVFREAPGDDAVRDQLQRLASIVDNWQFVADTYQKYIDDESGDTSEVREVAIALATIYDRRVGNVDGAFRAYKRAMAIVDDAAVPDTREVVRRIEELLGRSQKWHDLLGVYDELAASIDDDVRREALIKRARLLEDSLADTAKAVEAWREVVAATEDGGNEASDQAYQLAVRELERLYRQRGMWHEVVELLESRLERTVGAADIADLRMRLADVLENQLEDIPGAIERYGEIIAEGEGWARAVSSLERLVVHDEHREKVIELLEPVYRERDWWQKLVVVLDAKLEYIREPADQVSVLHEIAAIHEDRGGAIDLALAALARAWRLDVGDEAALAKLVVLAGKLEAWDEAVTTIEEGAESAGGGELGAMLWAKAAEIHEGQRNDLPRAIVAWRKVDEARTDDLVALAALDRLLALEGRVEELVKVVARRADLTEDAGVRLVLLHRVAALYEEVLEDKPNAIEAYKAVLSVDDTDLSALDALERLYRDARDWRELAMTLERKIELTTDVGVRQGLRHSLAIVYEQQLDDVYQAISQLTSVLDDDPGEVDALASLDRIYQKQKMWPELLDIVDKRALLGGNPRERADLGYRAARLVENELGEPETSIGRYGAVLGLVPNHDQARAALEALMAKDEHVEAVTPILERVYRSEREAAGLIRVYERRLGAPGRDQAARRADWEALADVRETLANQPAQAFVVWGRALTDEPESAELLVPLVRLAESQHLWRELATLLDERLEDAGQPLPAEIEQQYAMKLGQIAEDRLQDLDRAAAAYDRASNGPEPRPALAALERVLARAARYPELAACLRREADGAGSDAETAEYLFRLGDLQEVTLEDQSAAVAAYREVLQLLPQHAMARTALERMLGTAPGERAAIVEILEPLYEQDGDAARLVTALEAKLDVTTDAIERASVLQRVVELAEGKLNDRARALDAALRWLASDPQSQQALSESERLADRLGQWRETAIRVDAIVHAKDANLREPDVQVGLLVFLGKILRVRLAQNDDAITIYRKALELEPDSTAALEPLIEILRQLGRWPELAEALRQRGRAAQDTVDRRAAFAEVGELCERSGDHKGAVSAWREIADADDTDREALDQLARLHRQAGEKSDLVDVLQKSARMAVTPEHEKQLRVEIAQLESDGPRAVSAWQAVVDLDGEDGNALAQLEAAHARASDWSAVGDIQTRRLDLAKTSKDKIFIYADMARIAETRRNSPDDAVVAWYAALDIDNSHLPAYGELERLLGATSRWHDLVELLERLAELHATLGDTKAELGALARAADVWEGKLDNPDAAGEILEKILRREPGSVAALTRLSKIYERAGDWDKCKATLEQALRLGPSGRDAADLFFRLGEVARVGDRDDDTAIQHFQQALRHDAAHAGAVAALEKLARDRRDNVLLADMLQRRAATVTPGGDRVALYVEIAELERKAGRTDAAMAALAKAANDAPQDVRVLGPLADAYFAAGRLDEAAPIYSRLADEAKTARRMKDVARFRQRQGAILDARGDKGGALTAYEEALRVNPTDVATMTGLGRLYFSSGDWEKARKIYQSLVLQNIDPEAGVTKGEVYWALGKIHIELGQGPKAKSMFQRGLELEPGNTKLREALSSLS
jgi:tetratricopeptide (TPR) repeat protein